MTELRRGTAYAAAAYLLWGLFPLYWPLLDPASAVEVLAHRIVWSLVVVAVLLQVTRRWAQLRAAVADRRRLLRLSLAAVAIALNWGVYIYGVQSDQVVEASLGYFVSPLLTVLLGVLVLGEPLSRSQWISLGAAGLAVLVLTVEGGRPPWIALVLACSFGLYGLLKKTVGIGPLEGLAVETAVLTPVAAVFLLAGAGTFTTEGPGHVALLVGGGVVTAIPLLLFGAAAGRVTLTTLGMLQYVTPTIQFLIGVLLLHEPMGPVRLLGFALVWTALAVFTVDLLRQRRRGVVLEPA
ncbi:MAG: Protein rarD [Frankiales bacterium]|nr:Protein rarD [Frankiales bacterium]